MCGIVAGAQRNTPISSFLLQGLQALEYRGYDSAGLALLGEDRIRRYRAKGRVKALADKVADAGTLPELVGVGHTRWATHGAPCELNSHPHTSSKDGLEVAVVHNGIIENHEVLRSNLQAHGYTFTSQTDTEVIAHLLHQLLSRGYDLNRAVRIAREYLEGQYAFAVISTTAPGFVCATRQGAPLILGHGDSGMFVASDVSALLRETQRVSYLNDEDVVLLSATGYRLWNGSHEPYEPEIHVSELTPASGELQGYAHYMQKEMFEQPAVFAATVEAASDVRLDGSLFGPEAPRILRESQHVLILACGTSFHAGLVARYWIEAIAKIPCTVEIASEYHYRRPAMTPNTLVVVISQSGETADTRAALEYALKAGAKHSLAICNVPESTLTRMTQLRFITKACAEVGVASTKAFVTQLAALYLLTLCLASCQGSQNPHALQANLDALHDVTAALAKVLVDCDDTVARWAPVFARSHSAMYLGRDVLYPIAMEGALKLKEVSYVHAEAYAAGELKHGPLALIDEQVPVLVSANHGPLLKKVKSNIEEVLARNGDVFVIASRGCGLTSKENLHVYELPVAVADDLSPLIHVVVHQMLAYRAALERGTDIDKPRSLAKSVTTE